MPRPKAISPDVSAVLCGAAVSGQQVRFTSSLDRRLYLEARVLGIPEPAGARGPPEACPGIQGPPFRACGALAPA